MGYCKSYLSITFQVLNITMDYSSAHWSSTISTLLKKTEGNLYRHGSQPNLKIAPVKSQQKFSDSFYIHSKSQQNEDFSATSFDFQQFKNFVFENFKALNQDLQRINKKLIVKDQLDSEFFEHKEDFGLALEAIEKRCITEVRRIESSLVQFVTFETLKNTEEWLRSDNVEKFSQLELKFKDAKQAISALRENFSQESKGELSKIKQKFLRFEDLKKFKENWTQETSYLLNGSVQKFDSLEALVHATEQNVEQRLEEKSKQILSMVDKKNKILNENLAGFNKRLVDVSEDFMQKFENIRILSEENRKNIEQVVRDQLKLKPVEAELKYLKEKLISLPNFEDFSKKSELNELSNALSESQQNITFSTRQEIKRLSDSKPNFIEFVKKNELEELSATLIKKIEMVKIASAGKADVEKLNKIFKDIYPKSEIDKLKERVSESEGSFELFIEKLQILEKRIKGVEDKSVDNWKKSEEKTHPNKASNFSELCSKDTQSNSLSQNRKDRFEYNTKDFISSLCEEFINCEINFGVKTLKKLNKKPVPTLNFYAKAPSESPDDLNNAVILNTDLTNKSESPFDFSEI